MDEQIKCPQCGNDEFKMKQTLEADGGINIKDHSIDFEKYRNTDEEDTDYICKGCGYEMSKYLNSLCYEEYVCLECEDECMKDKETFIKQKGICECCARKD